MIHNINLRYKFFGDFYIGDDFLQAGETTLNKLLNTSRQFIVPIFQRNYSWQKSQYEQLWFDILRASKFKEKQNHFIGSIVYIDMGTPAGEWVCVGELCVRGILWERICDSRDQIK